MQKTIEVTTESLEMLEGLKARQKRISSKFFYDAEGSRIFQKIMAMPEYYLTDCEAEIFEIHKQSILSFSAAIAARWTWLSWEQAMDKDNDPH